jgi:hypothetical protein
MKTQIPEKLNQQILNSIKEKLNPPFHLIFLKIFCIHLLVALITMSFCPQMGVSFFKSKYNIMSYFMYFGTFYCDIFCGIFFTSISMVVAILFLSSDEKNIIRNKRLVTSFCLILLSLGILIIFNSKLFLEFSFLWFLGAMLGAISGIEVEKYFSRYNFI